MNTEQKILDAALYLFVTKGFSVTTSAITKRAGVSSGILFHYFPTKEELILTLYAITVLEYYQNSFMPSDMEYLADPTIFETYTKRKWCESVEWGVNNWNKFQYIQQFENTPYLEKYTSQTKPEIKQLQDSLVRITRSAIDKGYIKNLPFEYMIGIGGLFIVLAVKYLHDNPRTPTKKNFIEQACQSFWCAIKF